MDIARQPSVTFDTTLQASGNNTGIEVPPEALEQLGAGKRPGVVVNVNGYQYQTTVGSMGGRSMLPVSAAIRNETGLKGGDAVRVVVTLAEGKRAVEVPDDFAAAMEAAPGARAFFDGLSNSLQRYHVDSINGAKSEDTRQRRIAKSVELLASGKPR